MTDKIADIAAGQTPLDCNGRPILVGDVLKVFHFIGARRKRHFMFKQVVGTCNLGTKARSYLVVSHLNLKDAREADGGYYLLRDGSQHEDTEIVQGLDDFTERNHLKGNTHG